MAAIGEGEHFLILYRWFSRYVIAAMLVDENKRFLISSFCSSTDQQLFIAALLSVSLEIGLQITYRGLVQKNRVFLYFSVAESVSPFAFKAGDTRFLISTVIDKCYYDKFHKC